MADSLQASTVVCPLCNGTGFSAEPKGLVFKKTVFTCLACGSSLETTDGKTYHVASVGTGFSNAQPLIQGKSLPADQLRSHGVPIISDADLGEIASGQSPLLDQIIEQADQAVPAILKPGERVVLSIANVSLFEERRKRISSGAGALSFRVAKGIWYHTGRLSQPEYASLLQAIDAGSLALTTMRYVFIGATKTVDQQLSKITAITPFTDGIGIARSNKQKIEYFKGAYHWPYLACLFMGVTRRAS